MKTIILHGDDTVRSYDRLLKFIEIAKDRNWEVIRTKEVNLSVQELLRGGSLFQKGRLVVLEDINLLNKSVTDWLKKEEENIDSTFVIYSQGVVNQRLIKSLPTEIKVEEFKIRSQVWNLIESFSPGNAKNSIILLNEVVKKDPIEFVFTLLVRQLRDLYLLKIDPNALSYPPWRLTKLRRQASKFTEPLLREIIREIADADIKSKTSQVELKDSLDFIIISKLE